MHNIIYAVTFCLNIFPDEDGILDTLIPRAMITGQSVELTKNFLLDLEEYVHKHEYRENSMDSWTLKALVLCPTGKNQGGHYSLNLHTGRIITRFTWTALLLPTCIRKLVWRLAQQSPITIEVLDGLQHEVPDAETDNCKADEDYLPGEDDDNNVDGDDDDNIGKDNNIDSQQDTVNNDANENDDTSIILNPASPNHYGPISGVATEKYQTTVNTAAAGK